MLNFSPLYFHNTLLGIARDTQQDCWCAQQFFLIFKILLNISVEESSSAIMLYLWKNLFSCHLTEELLLQEFTEEDSFVVVNYNSGRIFFLWILTKELLPRDRTEEGSSTTVTGFFTVVIYNNGRTFFRGFLRKKFFCEITWKKFFRF